MSIEIRNFYPADSSSNITTFGDVSFDVVALDGYSIDITSLAIEISSDSLVDDETHTTDYVYNSSEVSYTGGATTSYRVIVNPSIPFESGLSVTVTVDVSGTTDLSVAYDMDSYTSDFTTFYNGIISDFRVAFIAETQMIPVHDEILRKNSTTSPTVFESAYNLWNQSPAPKIEINQVITASDDATNPYSLDWQNGRVNFASALDYNDQVKASYRFSYFTDEQINAYLQRATDMWRLSPSFGGPLTIDAAGSSYRGVIMIGAAQFAFLDLLMTLAFQENRIIFDNASYGEGWTQVKDLFKQLQTAYADMWKQMLEAKKARFPGISSLVASDFSLPGGRSRMFRYMYK